MANLVNVLVYNEGDFDLLDRIGERIAEQEADSKNQLHVAGRRIVPTYITGSEVVLKERHTTTFKRVHMLKSSAVETRRYNTGGRQAED